MPRNFQYFSRLVLKFHTTESEINPTWHFQQVDRGLGCHRKQQVSSAEEQQEYLLLAFSASLNVQLSVRGSSDFITSGTGGRPFWVWQLLRAGERHSEGQP